jgi:plastocyanin
MRLTRTLIPSLAIAFVAACTSDGDDGGPPNQDPVAEATVTMGLSSFSPSQVFLVTGGTVTWNNTSGAQHNITFAAANAPADIGNHTNGSNERDFPETGIFNYTCTNHAGMNGRVTVTAASVP